MRILSKRLSLFILLLLLILSITGCASRGLEAYKAAVGKTNQVKSGVEETHVNMAYTFNKALLSEEEAKALEPYEEMGIQFIKTFNKEIDQFAVEGHINFGGLGFDGSIYKNDKGYFAFLPMVNRYIHLEELMASDIFKSYTEGSTIAPPLSEASLEAMGKIWLDLLNEENVFSGSPVLMETPDGELKASVYEIKLSPEQIDGGLKKLLAILREDKAWVNFIDEQLKQSNQDFNLEALMEDKSWQEVLNSGVAFKYTAFVDRDDYVFKETVQVEVSMNQENNPLEKMQFTMDSQLSQREKVSTIHMPEFSMDNTMRPEVLKDWIDKLKK